MEADGDGGSGGTRVWSVLFPRTAQGTPDTVGATGDQGDAVSEVHNVIRMLSRVR